MAIHAAEDLEAAHDKANAVIEKLKANAPEASSLAGAAGYYGDADLLQLSGLPQATDPGQQSAGTDHA